MPTRASATTSLAPLISFFILSGQPPGAAARSPLRGQPLASLPSTANNLRLRSQILSASLHRTAGHRRHRRRAPRPRLPSRQPPRLRGSPRGLRLAAARDLQLCPRVVRCGRRRTPRYEELIDLAENIGFEALYTTKKRGKWQTVRRTVSTAAVPLSAPVQQAPNDQVRIYLRGPEKALPGPTGVIPGRGTDFRRLRGQKLGLPFLRLAGTVPERPGFLTHG